MQIPPCPLLTKADIGRPTPAPFRNATLSWYDALSSVSGEAMRRRNKAGGKAQPGEFTEVKIILPRTAGSIT
jgi:hypothetical protein